MLHRGSVVSFGELSRKTGMNFETARTNLCYLRNALCETGLATREEVETVKFEGIRLAENAAQRILEAVVKDLELAA